MRRAGLALLLALGPLGCGPDADDAQCHQNSDCGPGSACLGNLCVRMVGPEPEIWSLQVTPGAQPRYALREFPNFAFTAQTADLVLDRRTSMVTELSMAMVDPTIDMKTSVHIVLSVPSAIPDRGELQFEADGSNHASFLPYDVSIPIPAAFLGAAARMSVLPTVPLDRWMPPWTLAVTLATDLVRELPGTSDTVRFEGRLQPADPGLGLDVPYQARARVGGRLVSNVPVTDSMGNFVVKLQKSVVPAGGTGLVLELSPADATAALPSLVVSSLTLEKTMLGPLGMPAFPKPEAFVVPVVGRADRAPVVGATVSFKTTLAGATGGKAMYVRGAQTGSDGRATLALIPGASQTMREYSVKITPPNNSDYAAVCVPVYTVGQATPGTPRLGSSIELEPKMVLDGRVLRADGVPVASARVRPTRVGDSYAEACGSDLASAPADQTTDSEGRYHLRLDPGQYRLDCEPPQGAPLPTTSVLVTVPDTQALDVVLPVPVLVQGRVLAPDNTPLPDAEVRAFGPGPNGVLQTRGVALSDSEGKFRLILPRRP
jgi:protocatechuate 3,4-dioxygenase beta subunit